MKVESKETKEGFVSVSVGEIEETMQQMSTYNQALKGLRNLCLVYGARYAQDATKQQEITELLHTYSHRYLAFCVLKGLTGPALQSQISSEIKALRKEIYPNRAAELRVTELEERHPNRAAEPGFTELEEGPERQTALHAIQGMHTEEEVRDRGPKNYTAYLYRGSGEIREIL